MRTKQAAPQAAMKSGPRGRGWAPPAAGLTTSVSAAVAVGVARVAPAGRGAAHGFPLALSRRCHVGLGCARPPHRGVAPELNLLGKRELRFGLDGSARGIRARRSCGRLHSAQTGLGQEAEP